MADLKVGLIGAGWMGKAHAMSYRTARLAFDGKPAAAVLEVVADANEEIAARAAAEMGFRRHARDWREVVDDPSIDIVDITTPNDLHFDIAMAAIAAGKHIWCEKPLTNDVGTSFEMAEAAEKAGITTMVGFNYIKNPVQTLARRLIEDGEIGSVTYYRGLFNSDFLGRPDIPHSWRNDKARAGSGVIGDVGAHCFAYFRHLVAQPIEEVMCDLRIVVGERPRAEGADRFSQDAAAGDEMATVDTDDVATVLFRFAGGVTGHMEMSRIATRAPDGGRIRRDGDGRARSAITTTDSTSSSSIAKRVRRRPRGFSASRWDRRTRAMPRSIPVPGIGAGYNDFKVMEAQAFLEAIVAGEPGYPDFRFGAEVQRLVDACMLSDAEERWVKVAEVGP